MCSATEVWQGFNTLSPMCLFKIGFLFPWWGQGIPQFGGLVGGNIIPKRQYLSTSSKSGTQK